MSDKTCRQCGGPSKKTYCSKLCANRWWKQSAGFKKNKCIECEKPCSNLYCSYKCKAKKQIREYKAICQFCGNEFIFHKIGYQKRGQMKYCSFSCANAVYTLNDTFFTHHTNISEIYQILGFLFSCGKIFDIRTNQIEIKSSKPNLEKFNQIVKSDFIIKKAEGKDNFKLVVRSQPWIEYLFDIGFTDSLESHTFPTILDEYKQDFIDGYSNGNTTQTFNKTDEKLTLIKVKSYPLARGITDYLNCDLVTKHLGFICVVRTPLESPI